MIKRGSQWRIQRLLKPIARDYYFSKGLQLIFDDRTKQAKDYWVECTRSCWFTSINCTDIFMDIFFKHATHFTWNIVPNLFKCNVNFVVNLFSTLQATPKGYWFTPIICWANTKMLYLQEIFLVDGYTAATKVNA